MRRPASALVVDAAILIALSRGARDAVLRNVLKRAKLFTSSRAVQESRRRIELGMKRPDLLDGVDALIEYIQVVDVWEIADLLPKAQKTLLEAVASRNGSTSDDHILALAWHMNADIWSPDRDFAGTGVASWSTPNLIRALAA